MPVTDPAPWSRPPTAGEADGASTGATAATADGAAADAPDVAASDARGAAVAATHGSGGVPGPGVLTPGADTSSVGPSGSTAAGVLTPGADGGAADREAVAAAPADGSGAASVGKSGAAIVCSEVTTRPVSATELARQVSCAAAGAVVTFEGVVRDHDDGRGVRGITYSAHPMATDVMTQVVADVAAHPGLRALGVVHRVGDLVVGDTALAVAVSADHRAEAFAAASALVEQVKARLPVWKHQLFADGTAEWSNMA